MVYTIKKLKEIADETIQDEHEKMIVLSFLSRFRGVGRPEKYNTNEVLRLAEAKGLKLQRNTFYSKFKKDKK